MHIAIPSQGSQLRRTGTFAVLAALCLTLAACLLTPGKFTSQLDIRKDGRFSFSYSGEIYMMALSKLAETKRGAGSSDVFKAEPCYEPDSSNERKCTPAEMAEQRRTWREKITASDDKRKRDADSMKAMLGGIDPTNPKAAEELAARLRRQAGWRRVDYKGDGLFDVDFAISGTIDRDFTFPSIERLPMANAFLTINRHKDGSLRIDAPGYAGAGGGDMFRSMMQSGAMSESKDTPVTLPTLDGNFSLTTDAEILANNTDEGPKADTAGKRLDWAVNARATAAPTALLQLQP